MAETGARVDPALAFRFEVTFDDLPPAASASAAGCSSRPRCRSTPRAGRTTVCTFPTRTKQTPIVLKRGIVDRALWDWYGDVVQGAQFRDGSVIVRDEPAAATVAEWQLRRRVPVQVDRPGAQRHPERRRRSRRSSSPTTAWSGRT